MKLLLRTQTMASLLSLPSRTEAFSEPPYIKIKEQTLTQRGQVGNAAQTSNVTSVVADLSPCHTIAAVSQALASANRRDGITTRLVLTGLVP